MLERFLETGYARLTADESRAFEQLLDSEDDRLADWLITGREAPDDARLRTVVEYIRRA